MRPCSTRARSQSGCGGGRSGSAGDAHDCLLIDRPWSQPSRMTSPPSGSSKAPSRCSSRSAARSARPLGRSTRPRARHRRCCRGVRRLLDTVVGERIRSPTELRAAGRRSCAGPRLNPLAIVNALGGGIPGLTTMLCDVHRVPEALAHSGSPIAARGGRVLGAGLRACCTHLACGTRLGPLAAGRKCSRRAARARRPHSDRDERRGRRVLLSLPLRRDA